MRRSCRHLLSLLVVFCLLQPSFALELPKGKTILTFSGNISEHNRGETAELDLAMLEKLPQHSFSAKTPWYKESHTFTGPLLRDVLAMVGAKGKGLKALALNDYKTQIPAEDAGKFDVIVARLMDGKPMSVRDKGPLFIIYPFDSSEVLRSELYYGRSAWQLKAIIVE